MNECGECSACCHTHGCDEIGKKPFADCRHLLPLPVVGRCGVYADRPQSCRDFNCAWLADFLGDNPDWRPDRSGLVVTATPGGWAVSEFRPGAADEAGSRPLLAAVERLGGQITLVRPAERMPLVNSAVVQSYLDCSFSFQSEGW
jgi:hypothetical protein